MPYIKQIERDKFDKHIEELLYELCNNGLFEPGQMNYIISKLIKGIIKRIGISYSLCNNITGVLGCVKKEFYRRTVAPYEDQKIIENGDI